MSSQHNQVYPSALDALLRGEVDVTSGPLRAAFVDGTYVFDPTHSMLIDADSSILATTDELTGVGVDGGRVTGDPAAAVSVTGDPIEGVIVYVATGDSSTSQLLAFIARRADTVPLDTPVDGGTVAVAWPNFIFRI